MTRRNSQNFRQLEVSKISQKNKNNIRKRLKSCKNPFPLKFSHFLNHWRLRIQILCRQVNKRLQIVLKVLVLIYSHAKLTVRERHCSA